MFHVLFLHDCQSNNLHADVLPIQVNGEDEYEVSHIEGHRMQWQDAISDALAGYDASEDM